MPRPAATTTSPGSTRSTRSGETREPERSADVRGRLDHREGAAELLRPHARLQRGVEDDRCARDAEARDRHAEERGRRPRQPRHRPADAEHDGRAGERPDALARGALPPAPVQRPGDRAEPAGRREPGEALVAESEPVRRRGVLRQEDEPARVEQQHVHEQHGDRHHQVPALRTRSGRPRPPRAASTAACGCGVRESARGSRPPRRPRSGTSGPAPRTRPRAGRRR